MEDCPSEERFPRFTYPEYRQIEKLVFGIASEERTESRTLKSPGIWEGAGDYGVAASSCRGINIPPIRSVAIAYTKEESMRFRGDIDRQKFQGGRGKGIKGIFRGGR